MQDSVGIVGEHRGWVYCHPGINLLVLISTCNGWAHRTYVIHPAQRRRSRSDRGRVSKESVAQWQELLFVACNAAQEAEDGVLAQAKCLHHVCELGVHARECGNRAPLDHLTRLAGWEPTRTFGLQVEFTALAPKDSLPWT